MRNAAFILLAWGVMAFSFAFICHHETNINDALQNLKFAVGG